MVLCGLLLGGCASAEEEQPATPELPAVSLFDASYDTPATASELIRESYVVARGRFVGGPVVVSASTDPELPSELVVWEFVPDEVYRDVRVDDAPARVAEEQRGSILVAAGAIVVGQMRGDQPLVEFVQSFPSTSNVNGFPLDRPVYVFLSPGVMPRDAVERDPELTHVMGLAGPAQCYLVDDLSRSCGYVADTPGGDPGAVLEAGNLVPSGLTVEAIEGSASLREVVSAAPYAELDPLIDAERFVALPAEGGEG
ncbi:hypothetical protein [Blastococcus sp. TF02A-26]|uniref:hypothetical protein n=1 Tax=Blastococcus sp. TF02A-26 TaxID=2250577 RepID=UPI000DE9157A|nr:hypothetical protein [Blastococcus sp. TF02A-26]RBY86176.1 hypothetical protein DQ240_10315 [Blastococcus sp. TF02A-26]